MMARSNLNLHEELITSFTLAQQFDQGIRGLKIVIQTETLVVDAKYSRTASASIDFQTYVTDGLDADKPAIVLYCAADTADERASWILLSYIPDTARVREKMLYSTCREDLKRGLGTSFFKGEYGANEPSELSWDAMSHYFARDRSELFLTEREKMLQEETKRIDSETVFTKTNMMAVLPFTIAPELIEKLAIIKTNEGEFNWIEIIFENETLKLSGTDNVNKDDTSWAKYIRSEEPRFYIFCLPKIDSEETVLFLCFFCPETAPVRLKMTMSSSKATLIAHITSLGLKFKKTFEVQEPGEIDEYITPELEDNNTTTTAGS